MKKLIYQYSNPTLDIANKSIQSISTYSKLIKADHIVYDKNIVINNVSPGNYWGIFYPFLYDLELLLKYDKICYIDTDVLATTHLNDIFTNEGYILGCHNYASMHRNLDTEMHDAYLHFDTSHSSFSDYDKTILNSLTNIAKYNSRGINSGVVLFDKHIIKYFSEWLYDNLPYLLNIEDNNPILWRELGKYDQTIINIFIGENPKNMGNLNAIFNWRLNRCEYSNRWIATLIHYIIKINKHYLLEDYPNDRILK